MSAKPVHLETVNPVDKPQNGVAGLKHWRYDLRSGFMVALISLPFSMGIAMTSGAPPVCGIVSAIIAGFLLPFLGGSYVTISGPAAGLAPVLFAGMIALGHGDLAVGYPRVLVAICIAGIAQLLLARLKVARLSAMFPAAAIEGMLAAIGMMIIVKQVPLFFGQKFEAHEFWEILEEIPARLSAINPQVFWLGAGCLALIFGLSAIPSRVLKVMPPPVWAFLLGTIVARFALNLGPESLINVPEAPLANGIVLPDLQGVINDSTIWVSLGLLAFTLVLIDGTESLATIAAVDKLDPYRRKSDPDRTLSAMGASNLTSSVLGGLTIIPGIVKSTANILGGGRTQWANFYNASFLLGFLVFGRNLINMVPTCVLAAILVFIGYKLCGPKVWLHMARLGKQQFAIFTATVLVTVTTDLLVGIVAGVALKYGLCLWYHIRNAEVDPWAPPGMLTRFIDLFRNPVRRRQYADGVYDLYLERPLVCFNLFHLIREMDRIPADATEVSLHITKHVSVIDHTSCENLFHYLDEYNSGDGKPHLAIQGLDVMRPVSRDKASIRVADRSVSSAA
ncbi:MAG: SulP family inorganic anion transporter [Planctomycetia bacterium]|nr:SulP family inorganic anion transporter [Planctomycetia bacterium]